MKAEFDDRHYDVWREQICDQLLGIDTPRPTGSRFGASVDVTPLAGPVLIDAESRCRGLAFVLTPQRIARPDNVDAVGLTLVLSGAAEVASGTRSVELRPGDVSLLESREPFRKTCSADYREQFFYLPRAFVDATAGVRFASGGQLVAPREGMGQVLADTITSFARHRRVIPAHDWQPLVTGITQVAAAVFTDRASSEETQPTIRALTRARVERYIDAHLDDPTLSPPLIAARIGCSVRYLHLIFEGSGTSIGATLLARRLERCHQRLTDPREAHRSISEIAFAAGFNDAAHFSRTFKARFGVSPRELRSLDRPPRRATPE